MTKYEKKTVTMDLATFLRSKTPNAVEAQRQRRFIAISSNRQTITESRLYKDAVARYPEKFIDRLYTLYKEDFRHTVDLSQEVTIFFDKKVFFIMRGRSEEMERFLTTMNHVSGSIYSLDCLLGYSIDKAFRKQLTGWQSIANYLLTKRRYSKTYTQTRYSRVKEASEPVWYREDIGILFTNDPDHKYLTDGRVHMHISGSKPRIRLPEFIVISKDVEDVKERIGSRRFVREEQLLEYLNANYKLPR